jgi:hypothetical protein
MLGIKKYFSDNFLRKSISLLVISNAIFVISNQLFWYAGFKLLSSFGLNFMPLAEESALLFILSNVLLLIINNQKHNRLLDPLILFVISIIGMIAMITMYDIFTDYRWGGSDFIGEKGLFRSGFPTGKMSLITCFCFLLTSCSLYCIRFKFLKVVAYTNLMILAIAYIVLIGYIYGVPSLYNSSFIPMSWPASIAFIITSLGLILAAGNKSAPIIYFVGNTTRARLMRNLLPFTLLLLIVKIL